MCLGSKDLSAYLNMFTFFIIKLMGWHWLIRLCVSRVYFSFLFNFYCIFSITILSPCTCPSYHHTVVHVHVSFYFFTQSLHSLTPPLACKVYISMICGLLIVLCVLHPKSNFKLYSIGCWGDIWEAVINSDLKLEFAPFPFPHKQVTFLHKWY